MLPSPSGATLEPFGATLEPLPLTIFFIVSGYIKFLMPIRRRRAPRKAPRRMRRQARRPRVPRALSAPTRYNYTRKAVLTALVPGLAITNYTYTFALSDLPGVSDFTAMYDQYRLNAVKLMFYPNLTSADANPIGTIETVPRAFFVIDYDDSTTLGTINTALEHQNVKIRQMHKPFSIFLRPKSLTEVYCSAVTTAYAPKKSQVLDMAYTDVPHWGVKILVDAVFTAQAFSMTCVGKYYFTCYNAK